MFHRQEGIVLIFGVILLAAFTGTVIAYISLVSSEAKHIGYQIGDSQAFYLAESGLQKAIWRLKYDKDWGQAGETETLSLGKSYIILPVQNNDFVGTTAEGFDVIASSKSGQQESTLAIDNNMATYWESNYVPGSPRGRGGGIVEEWISITFPSVVFIDRARFRLESAYSNQRPVDYTWSVKRQTGSWIGVATVSNNPDVDVTNTFGGYYDVKYLRLLVTKAGDGTSKVVVAEIESPYISIESQGIVQHPLNNLTRTVSQDFLLLSGIPANNVEPRRIKNIDGSVSYNWQEK